MLRADNLKKIYFNGSQELVVLKGVSLFVAQSEVVSIVGPSGAGKSTLLHILGGLDEPSSGEVFLNDIPLSGLNDVRRSGIRNTRFGFVFQFYHLLREFNALENVMMPGLITRALRKKAVEDKAKGLLGRLGLSKRMFHRPSQLSGGEQQRVAIARALINDPEVLFCDEPTGNLDYESGTQIHDMLLSLNREKKTTIVIVTHSRDLAEGSHRVLNILDGRIKGE